jgi:hypothetical protein
MGGVSKFPLKFPEPAVALVLDGNRSAQEASAERAGRARGQSRGRACAVGMFRASSTAVRVVLSRVMASGRVSRSKWSGESSHARAHTTRAPSSVMSNH